MGLDLSKEFGVTDEAEDGKWFEDFAGDDKARIKLRSTDSDAYEKLMSRKRKKLRGSSSEKKLQKVIQEALAECIILDWEGIDMDGKEFPCNIENKKKAVALKPFRDEIMGLASDLEGFKEGAEEE